MRVAIINLLLDPVRETVVKEVIQQLISIDLPLSICAHGDLPVPVLAGGKPDVARGNFEFFLVGTYYYELLNRAALAESLIQSS